MYRVTCNFVVYTILLLVHAYIHYNFADRLKSVLHTSSPLLPVFFSPLNRRFAVSTQHHRASIFPLGCVFSTSLKRCTSDHETWSCTLDNRTPLDCDACSPHCWVPTAVAPPPLSCKSRALWATTPSIVKALKILASAHRSHRQCLQHPPPSTTEPLPCKCHKSWHRLPVSF